MNTQGFHRNYHPHRNRSSAREYPREALDLVHEGKLHNFLEPSTGRKPPMFVSILPVVGKCISTESLEFRATSIGFRKERIGKSKEASGRRAGGTTTAAESRVNSKASSLGHGIPHSGFVGEWLSIDQGRFCCNSCVSFLDFGKDH